MITRAELGRPNTGKQNSMAWKIAGIIEGRSGNVAILPEWCIGGPNDFKNVAEAETIREAMANAVAKDKTAIRYVLLPAIDDALIAQVRELGAPQPAPARTVNALSSALFGGSGPRREPPPA